MSFHELSPFSSTFVHACLLPPNRDTAARVSGPHDFRPASMFKISIEPWDSRVSPSICSLLKAQKGEQSKILKPRNFSPELPIPQSVRCFQTLPGSAGAPGTVCKSEVTSFNPTPPFKQDRSSGNGFCPQQILQFFYSCTKLQYTDRILFDTIEAWFREILMLKPILALYERRSKHDISLHPSP